MTFNLTLTSYQLAELKAKLGGLVTEMDYDPTTGELSIDSSDPVHEPRIVDSVASVTRTADLPLMDEPAIDYAELAREAQRAKRLVASEERRALERIRVKRRRQIGAMVVGL